MATAEPRRISSRWSSKNLVSVLATRALLVSASAMGGAASLLAAV